ncbi:Guanine exchange factor for Rac 30 [Diplonema papillatum]|nr:Guanine exchange factor for Rac 30 [Diplonema papillatum]
MPWCPCCLSVATDDDESKKAGGSPGAAKPHAVATEKKSLLDNEKRNSYSCRGAHSGAQPPNMSDSFTFGNVEARDSRPSKRVSIAAERGETLFSAQYRIPISQSYNVHSPPQRPYSTGQSIDIPAVPTNTPSVPQALMRRSGDPSAARKTLQTSDGDLGSDEEYEQDFSSFGSPDNFLPPPDNTTAGDDADQQYRALLNFLKKEFIEVEENYVRALDQAISAYLTPLLTNEILPHKIVNEIFGSLYNIKAVNGTFLQELKKAVSQHQERTRNEDDFSGVDFGPACKNHLRAFRILTPYFKLYEDFIAHVTDLPPAKKYAYDTFTHNAAMELEAQCEEEGRSGLQDLSIMSLLVRPIQMLAQYRTIFQRLVDSTRSSEPGFDLLKDALREATSVCNYCNQRKVESDGTVMLAAIEQKWEFTNLARPGRYWVMDGEMERLASRGRSMTRCVVFLFNDLLVCVDLPNKPVQEGKRRVIKLEIDDDINIDSKLPSDLRNSSGRPLEPGRCLSVGRQHSWYLVLILPSDTLKSLWHEALRNVQGNLKRRTKCRTRHRSTIGLDLNDD